MQRIHRQQLLWLPIVAALGLTACGRVCETVREPDLSSPLARELEAIKATHEQEQQHLATFDDLDFNVYSNQKWDELAKSHAPDIIVHWPDGRVTTGIEPHIADLKQQFVFAPDTKISTHPIKIAQGNWTAVAGVMEGTFTQPMALANGKPVKPTNKPFKLDMVTIGRWENGVMKEEWLVWDNQAFMKQIGLAK